MCESKINVHAEGIPATGADMHGEKNTEQLINYSLSKLIRIG